ncbi:MAG TPA: polysaccharide deacetylase family protein [Acidimicrobiales bacterium]|nr:polysaccharide deacetylase family protein [Acidimicrobiales bacterium]
MLNRRRHRGGLLVLAYHDVPDRGRFEAQLDHLVRHYRPVDLGAVVNAQRGDGSLPGRAVLVTFDDGHRSVLDAALPALRKREIPAVLFVVTGLIDSEQPYWWTEVERRSSAGGRAKEFTVRGRTLVSALKKVDDSVRLRVIEDLRESTPSLPIRVPQLTTAELRTLENSGVAIGSHTVTHPCLHRCSPDKIVTEVGDSYRHLTDALGHEPLAFAYPNGDHDERVVAAVRDTGYRAAFRFDHKIGPFPAVDPMLVSRVRVNADDPLDRFVLAASGVHPAVHRLRGRR